MKLGIPLKVNVRGKITLGPPPPQPPKDEPKAPELPDPPPLPEASSG